MQRAQQKSYCKTGINWHGNTREAIAIAAPIIVYESAVPTINSFADERAFEEALVKNRAEEQARLEQQFKKPSTLPVVETCPFTGADTFESWLANQFDEQIKETEVVQGELENES